MVIGRAALLVELLVCLACVCCATVSWTFYRILPPVPFGQSKDTPGRSAPPEGVSSMTQWIPCKPHMPARDVH